MMAVGTKQALAHADPVRREHGNLENTVRVDRRIANFLIHIPVVSDHPQDVEREVDINSWSEDALKAVLEQWLQSQGWEPTIAWGHTRGIDIDARRGTDRWIIEVKGQGSRPEMRVNYFIAMLGELLQRMDDPSARYSIALPDIPQFRRLWQRLPRLAKDRTSFTALFIDRDGVVHHVG